MQVYKKKMKRTLLWLLGIFIVTINLVAFYVLTSSLESKHLELSQTHMEHQYQSFQQRLSVLDQQLSLLSADAQLTHAVKSKDNSTALKKMQNFKQSTHTINSLAVFTLENDRVSLFASEGTTFGYGKLPSSSFHIAPDNMEGSFWRIVHKDKSYFLYFCPLTYNGQTFGCLIAEIDLDNLMSELLSENPYTYLSEHSAIVSENLIWSDDEEYWSENRLLECNRKEDYQVIGNTIYVYHPLTSSGDYFLQSVVLRTWSLYVRVAIGLIAIAILSFALVYIAISKTIDNIFIKLSELKEKMERMA